MLYRKSTKIQNDTPKISFNIKKIDNLVLQKYFNFNTM